MVETERLRLRPFVEDDASAYAALVGDPEVMRFVGGPADAETAARQLAGIAGRAAPDGFGVLAAERRSDGRLVGRIGFWIWNRLDWTAGWTRDELAGDARSSSGGCSAATPGTGGTPRRRRALLRHGFGDLGLTRVISLSDPRDTASLRVAERLGVVYEQDIVSSRFGAMRLYRDVPPGRLT